MSEKPPTQFIHPEGVPSQEAVGTPSIQTPVTVRPVGVTSVEAVGMPRIVTVREFYVKNRKWQAAQLALLAVSTSTGFVWSGLPGAVVAVGLSLVSYLLVPQGITKVREIRS